MPIPIFIFRIFACCSIAVVLQLSTVVVSFAEEERSNISNTTSVSKTLTPHTTPQLLRSITPPVEDLPMPQRSPDMDAQAQNRNIYISVMCVGLVVYVLSGSLFAIKSVRDQKNAFSPTGTAAAATSAAAASSSNNNNNNVATTET